MQTRLASQHAHRTLVAATMAIAATFGVALVLSLTSAAYARNRVPSHLTVAGLSVGSVPLPDARAELTNAVTAYARSKAVVRNGSDERHVTNAELGVTIDVDATLRQASETQQEGLLFGLFAVPTVRSTHDLPLVVTLDEEKFARFVEEEELRGSTPPLNARLAVAHGVATIVPERDGTRHTVTTKKADIVAHVRQLQPVAIATSREPWQASVQSDDLRDAAAVYAAMVSAPVTMTYNGSRWQMTVADIERWVVPVGEGMETLEGADFAFAEHFVDSFLQPIVDALHVPAKPTFGYQGGAQGVYAYKNFLGRTLDVDETVKRLLTAIREPAPRMVELPVVDEQPAIEYRTVVAPKPEGKVIQVALEEQALFAFENGELMFWTRISSGKAPRTTPVGEWKVYTKSAIQKMSGPGYYLPNVRWVLPYDGDYTIHGAYWHTKFGQPMSHGCTNMFDDDAKWVFDWAEVGTPVFVVANATER